MRRRNRMLCATVMGGLISAPVSVLAAMTAVPPPAGSTKGTLTVGATKLALSHAYALPRKPKDGGQGGVHLFLTSKPLPVGDIKDVAESSAVGMFLLEHEMQGIEAIVTADGRVTRVNLRHPELEAMGMGLGVMLLEQPKLEVAALDAQKLHGRLFTDRPITDGRIAGKPVSCDVTFAAAILGAGK